MINKKINNLLLASAMGLGVLSSSSLMAEEKMIVPSVHPTKACKLYDLQIPEGMPEYKFLASKNCETVFVKPALTSKQDVIARPHPNLRKCDDLRIKDNSLTKVSKQIENTEARIEELTLMEYDTVEELEAIEKEIAILDKRVEKMLEKEAKASAAVDKFDKFVGGEFSIEMKSEVRRNDIRDLEKANLVQHVVKDDEGNIIDEYMKGPHFQPANLTNSIYSFIFYSPKQEDGVFSIMSSTIPGLQMYQQEGSQMGVAHVKTNGGITGDVKMRLPSLCGYEFEKADGTWGLKPEGNPIFTVNRTYEVQQQFDYGYKASLVIDKTIEQIAKETITHKNKGFTKKQLFENSINSGMKSTLSFEWDSSFNTADHNVDGEKIQEIKTAVFANFVDDYFDALVKSGKLEIVQPSSVKNAEGNYIDEDKVGLRCWIETKWYGRRRKKCANYTYKVKVWKDGLTEKDITQTLNIDYDGKETMRANVATPFFYTTTFKPNLISN